MKAEEWTNPRIVAAEIVRRWMETGEFPDRAMDRVRADRPFVMELVYGTVKWKRELEWMLKQCSKRLPEVPLRAHTMVGLQQLLHMDRVEAYAAVNETVAGVKVHFGQPQADFVNAVLRRALREKQALVQGLANQPLAVRTSHPDDLVERWVRAFGEERTAALCDWNNRPATVILRVNLGRITLDDFRERLSDMDIHATPHPFDRARFCVLPRGIPVERVPGFDDGWFVVQDPSTLLAVDMLDPRPRERILDACAAPGGKTMALAERMDGGEGLTAMDLHEDRLVVLRKNLDRMSYAAVQVMQGDMADPGHAGALEGEEFDAILLDVPCMNTGVLQRRPDARWRLSADRLRKIVRQQRGILDGAAGKVRSGGRLVYSTCSLEPEEDERLVAGWLDQHPDFSLAEQRKLFPPEHQTDGAYAALLVRGGLRSG